jgi:hypothetical protein
VIGQLKLEVLRDHFSRLGLVVCAAACLLMDPCALPNDVLEMFDEDCAALIDTTYTLTQKGLSLPAASQVVSSSSLV